MPGFGDRVKAAKTAVKPHAIAKVIADSRQTFTSTLYTLNGTKLSYLFIYILCDESCCICATNVRVEYIGLRIYVCK